jgi:uncharacterized Zn-finger protein
MNARLSGPNGCEAERTDSIAVMLGIPARCRYRGRNQDERVTDRAMADYIVPHFHNEPGVPVIEIGAKEFMCVGAKPPFDHPHVFLDMGDEREIICPYCSTLFRYDSTLDPHASRPAECALREQAA